LHEPEMNRTPLILLDPLASRRWVISTVNL
jgi:hypothetical protein